jgi:hypothetical protein
MTRMGLLSFMEKRKSFIKNQLIPHRKKKRLSIENSEHNHSRKSSQSKTSQRSSKSNSKERNVFKKNINPPVNIYTSENLNDKSSKKLFSSGDTSKSKTRKKLNSSNSQDKNNLSHSKKLKKS